VPKTDPPAPVKSSVVHDAVNDASAATAPNWINVTLPDYDFSGQPANPGKLLARVCHSLRRGHSGTTVWQRQTMRMTHQHTGQVWDARNHSPGDQLGTTRCAPLGTIRMSVHRALRRVDGTDKCRRLVLRPGGQLVDPPSLTRATDTNGSRGSSPASDRPTLSVQMRECLGQLCGTF
jgi:hypothetical protein